MNTLNPTNIVELIVALTPIIALFAKFIDMRQDRRQRSALKLNALLLWGVRATGEISRQCALAQKYGTFSQSAEEALIEYDRFIHELDRFLNEQSSGMI